MLPDADRLQQLELAAVEDILREVRKEGMGEVLRTLSWFTRDVRQSGMILRMVKDFRRLRLQERIRRSA